ncbi:hypothetical protein WJX74_005607 [Apatococcus lobatus]|uniref:Uncharacterized protein n=1 Tax=Apatococcus lobatus TaxID=904363 RepID=A0AAW1SA73_9CHLO
MQDLLELTAQQQKLAKLIWREWQEGLAHAKEERQQILSEMQASGAAASMQRGMRPDRFSETSVFLEQAAALAENCVIQQEITIHCHHRFLLQVCTPESIAQIWRAAWPCWPDKINLLRQLDALRQPSQGPAGVASVAAWSHHVPHSCHVEEIACKP